MNYYEIAAVLHQQGRRITTTQEITRTIWLLSGRTRWPILIPGTAPSKATSDQ